MNYPSSSLQRKKTNRTLVTQSKDGVLTYTCKVYDENALKVNDKRFDKLEKHIIQRLE